jgi:hypothetical protein
VGASNNSWFVTPGSDGNGGVSSQDGQQYIQINNNLPVEIGTSYGTENESIWRFGLDGDLTLPAGGTINNTDGIVLVTDRGTLAIGTNMEGPGVAGHLHIAFNGSNSNPPASDLFLGDDYNYVKLPGYELNPTAQFGVEIGTNNRSLGPQNVEVYEVDELVPPGGVWRLFIIIEDYPNLGSLVSVGDTVTTSWGTPITATVTGVVEAVGDGDWQIQVDQDITAGFSAGPKQVSFGTSGNSYTWRFGTDGVLTLPQGSYIDETAAPLGTAKSLDLHPGNPVYPTQYLRIYPTNGGDADHLHLTSGDLTATELFLGDDEQYVKLTNTGNVEIRTGAFDYYNDTKGVWTFDSDGVLTLPTHNATLGSRIKSAVDITIETGRYYLVDLVSVGGGGVVDGPGTVDFLISSAPDWETAVAVGDHVVSGTWTDIITDISNLGEGRWRIEFASSVFSGATNTYSFYKPGAAGGTWNFGANGALRYPRNAVQQPTDTVECLGNTSTVVYTASSQYQNTIKLLIQVEGYVGAPGSWDTQSCEIMVAKSWRADDIASTVYGIVHTSVAPLATFTAEWNALTNRVQVMCATPSANSVYVRTFATEITTAD